MIDILRLGVTICAPSERESRNGRFDYKADGQFKGNEYLSSFGGKNGKGGLRKPYVCITRASNRDTYIFLQH